jgi:hypothetical protein
VFRRTKTYPDDERNQPLKAVGAPLHGAFGSTDCVSAACIAWKTTGYTQQAVYKVMAKMDKFGNSHNAIVEYPLVAPNNF